MVSYWMRSLKNLRRKAETWLARRVDVLLKDLGLKKKPENIDSVILVQDATANDPVAGKSAAELLREELNGIAEGSKDIYLCCVNRGILSQTVALSTGEEGRAKGLATTITVLSPVVQSLLPAGH